MVHVLAPLSNIIVLLVLCYVHCIIILIIIKIIIYACNLIPCLTTSLLIKPPCYYGPLPYFLEQQPGGIISIFAPKGGDHSREGNYSREAIISNISHRSRSKYFVLLYQAIKEKGKYMNITIKKLYKNWCLCNHSVVNKILSESLFVSQDVNF